MPNKNSLSILYEIEERYCLGCTNKTLCKNPKPYEMYCKQRLDDILTLHKQGVQPLVGALETAKKQILHLEDKCPKTYDSTHIVIAQIDTVLDSKK